MQDEYQSNSMADAFNAIPFHDAHFRMGLKSFDDLSMSPLGNLFAASGEAPMNITPADEGHVQQQQTDTERHLQDATDSYEAAPMNLVDHDYNVNAAPRGETVAPVYFTQHQPAQDSNRGPRFDFPGVAPIEGELDYFNDTQATSFPVEGEIHSDSSDPEFEYDYAALMSASPQQQHEMELELWNPPMDNVAEEDSVVSQDSLEQHSERKFNSQDRWPTAEEMAAVWTQAAQLFSQTPSSNPNTFQAPHTDQLQRHSPFQSHGTNPQAKFSVKQNKQPPVIDDTPSFPLMPKTEQKSNMVRQMDVEVEGSPSTYDTFLLRSPNTKTPSPSSFMLSPPMKLENGFSPYPPAQPGQDQGGVPMLTANPQFDQLVDYPELKLPEAIQWQSLVEMNDEGSSRSNSPNNDSSNNGGEVVWLDPNERVGDYTREERYRKIQKYIKGRKDRVYGKTIRYHSRKRFADARPRVGGRFVKLKKTNSPQTDVPKIPKKSQPVAMDMSG